MLGGLLRAAYLNGAFPAADRHHRGGRDCRRARGLARRTQLSTGEIERSKKAEALQAQGNLENILDAIGLVARPSRQISINAEEQTAVALEINRHTPQIDQAAERATQGR